MQGLTFRDPLPVKESREEKNERIRRERQESDSFLRYRMRVISETYSVPLEELYRENMARRILEECNRKNKTKTPLSVDLKTNHVRIDNQGQVVPSRLVLPKASYHSSRYTYRVFHSPSRATGDQITQGRLRPHFERPGRPPGDAAPAYNQYISRVTDAMLKTTAKEAQMKGRSDKGSFLTLSPSEDTRFKHQIKTSMVKKPPANIYKHRILNISHVQRLTLNLVDKKMEDVGKVVWFKGKGIPGAAPRPASHPGTPGARTPRTSQAKPSEESGCPCPQEQSSSERVWSESDERSPMVIKSDGTADTGWTKSDTGATS